MTYRFVNACLTASGRHSQITIDLIIVNLSEPFSKWTQTMMKQKIYQIDAFTNRVFSGNPAAICPLEKWLSDDLLRNIAMENNLAETPSIIKLAH